MSEKRKFQLSVKFGSGYEAPMLNIEGDDPVEFRENVLFATDSVEAIVDAAVMFQASYNVKKPQDAPKPAPAPAQRTWSNSGSQQQTQAAPAADTAPPGPPPSCAHGEMRWRPPGISRATKKAYNGFWACTAPRDQQCQPVNV